MNRRSSATTNSSLHVKKPCNFRSESSSVKCAEAYQRTSQSVMVLASLREIINCREKFKYTTLGSRVKKLSSVKFSSFWQQCITAMKSSTYKGNTLHKGRNSNKQLNTAPADAGARTRVTPRLLWVALRALIPQKPLRHTGRLAAR